ITIDPSITHGTITTTPAAKADEDTEVTIAAARDENYKLKAGSVKVTKTGDETTEVEVTDGKFIMPAYDVTVTAEFEASTETEGQLYVNGAYTSLETDATHFKTISEAVAAAKVINPQSEQNRVVINVYPGDYEEQVRMDQMKYVTLQQTPETNGKVNLSWYFCTNYYTSNTDLNGQYDPKIDWSLDETWNGYNEGDEKFTKYTIGQDLSGVSTISYYDTDGVKHKDVAKNSMLDRLGGLAWSYDKMAPLIVTSSSSDITIKDLNLINSTVVMKTKGQDDGHLTPNPSGNLPDHKALSICDETTTLVKPTADIFDDGGSVNLTKYKAYVASQGADFKFTPGESAWLLQSSGFNERGHAIAILGDRIICENVRVRGNQDSVWVSDGRTYFKNCDLIGGTDYIYGSASAVFDHCKLGFVGFTDKTYGSPLATPNTPASRKYGYLFFNCTIYNVRDNNGANNFGGPWGAAGQMTFYNTTLDTDMSKGGKSNFVLDPRGFCRFGAEQGLSRCYEYGTKNGDGTAADTANRVVNRSIAEGGYGMGTVLDEWQILEFNPRNYFAAANGPWTGDWDPMGFASNLTDIDAELSKNSAITVESGTDTVVDLPTPADNSVVFHWESGSANAQVN
ncbi:MAG: hypothetical protein IJP94_09375, partial [Clostridia bacterium]|nr:hypothetical protein [Clostridia bacterium]